MHNNTLQYSGNVDISIGRKRYIHRNSGTNELFKLICFLLCRSVQITNADLPSFVTVYATEKTQVRDTASSNKSIEVLRDPAIVNSEVEYTNEEGAPAVLKLYSSIDPSNVVSTADSKNYTLALLDGSQQHVLAKVALDSDNFKQIYQGSQAQIVWTISITNKQGE